MRKNRIFKNQDPLKTIDTNPFQSQGSKYTVASTLKSNANFSILEKLSLDDLMDKQKRQVSYGEVIRLAYIANNNQIHLDQEALYVLQRFTSSQIAFVGIYGKRGCGKSLLFDKILNLAGVQGSHFYRTSENYQKGLYFYSIPFQRPNSTLNIFLLDSVGFQKDLNDENIRQQDMILDLMMILCSSVIILPEPDDTRAEIFTEIYERIKACTQRVTQNKVPAMSQSQYWPKSIYCLFRMKQKINQNYDNLEKLFQNYNFSIIYDALPQQLKAKGITSQDLGEIQAIPQNNIQNLYINGQYVKQASRLARQVIQKVQNKKYYDLKYNGNICCKLLLTLIKHLNKKQRIKIDKIFYSLLKQLYQSAYTYHIEFYDEKLQQYLMQDAAYPMDYLIIAFQNCRQSILQSFRELTINDAMHEQYQEMIEQYVEEKEFLILEINKKKTKYQLKNAINENVVFPKNIVKNQQIVEFIETLKSTQEQLDHERCYPISNTLMQFANTLQRKYMEQAQMKEQIIINDLEKRISVRKEYLENDKKKNMANILLNDENQKKHQSLLVQNEGLAYKIKNVKKQIDIEKKFQKQYMANKQAAKQHAERLLTYIRQLEQKSRQNDKIKTEINKQFEYNPTIQILNKRIDEKIRQQRQLDRGGQSQISNRNFKRTSQVRNISSSKISGGIRSGIRHPSTIKG